MQVTELSSIVEHAWVGWILLAVVAGLLELLVPSFTFSLVAGAAAVCAVCSLFVGLPAQILIFCVAAFSLLLLLRPVLLKKFHVPHKMHSRSHQLMDMTGEVTESIDKTRSAGRVNVNGEDWSARADHVINAGQMIRVVGADGIVLLVKEV